MTRLGEVLETVRRSRGFTQQQLAELAGLTQAALSRYENDLREPDAEAMEALGAALGVTSKFLVNADRARAGMAVEVHMRRRATAPPGEWRRLESRLNVYRWHVLHLFEEVSLQADSMVPVLDPLDHSPEDAARLVRAQWGIPLGPVRGLAQWMEAAGCVLIREDFGTRRVDALSQWSGDHPVVLYNDVDAMDRVRLALTHELGHLVMHTDITGFDDIEGEANAFAAEFLMPEAVIRPSLRNLKVAQLLDLKREWGVSMQSLIERAHQLGLLGAQQRTNLYKSLSARGWRTREPGGTDIAAEGPQLTIEITRTLRSRGLSPAEIAQIVGSAGPTTSTLLPSNRLHTV